MSFTSSQVKEIAKGGLGEAAFDWDKNEKIDLNNPLTPFFTKYAALYLQAISKSIEKHELIGSGKMLKGIDKDISKDGKTLRIYMQNYYDYVNKGVKGVKSSTNAPNSKYQYKNYGMNASGRRSIKEYIESGKAKINVVKNKINTVGLEKKKISLIDLKTNTLIYLIKKYGIKTTNFFDEATDSVYKDMIDDIGEIIIQAIVIQIGKPSKKK